MNKNHDPKNGQFSSGGGGGGSKRNENDGVGKSGRQPPTWQIPNPYPKGSPMNPVRPSKLPTRPSKAAHDGANTRVAQGMSAKTMYGTALSRARAASKEFVAKNYPKAAHDGANTRIKNPGQTLEKYLHDRRPLDQTSGDFHAQNDHLFAPTTHVHHGKDLGTASGTALSRARARNKG